MKKAFLPGSFDPPTHGHLNIIERASKIFDELYVVIAINDLKTPLFSAEERLNLMIQLTKNLENVKIVTWTGLIVNFASKYNINVMIRGVRALADFSYEFELAMTNKSLKNNIEVIFFPTDPKFFVLRSSSIKEIAIHNGDISKMVPKLVERELKKKLKIKSI